MDNKDTRPKRLSFTPERSRGQRSSLRIQTEILGMHTRAKSSEKYEIKFVEGPYSPLTQAARSRPELENTVPSLRSLLKRDLSSAKLRKEPKLEDTSENESPKKTKSKSEIQEDIMNKIRSLTQEKTKKDKDDFDLEDVEGQLVDSHGTLGEEISGNDNLTESKGEQCKKQNQLQTKSGQGQTYELEYSFARDIKGQGSPNNEEQKHVQQDFQGYDHDKNYEKSSIEIGENETDSLQKGKKKNKSERLKYTATAETKSPNERAEDGRADLFANTEDDNENEEEEVDDENSEVNSQQSFESADSKEEEESEELAEFQETETLINSKVETKPRRKQLVNTENSEEYEDMEELRPGKQQNTLEREEDIKEADQSHESPDTKKVKKMKGKKKKKKQGTEKKEKGRNASKDEKASNSPQKKKLPKKSQEKEIKQSTKKITLTISPSSKTINLGKAKKIASPKRAVSPTRAASPKRTTTPKKTASPKRASPKRASVVGKSQERKKLTNESMSKKSPTKRKKSPLNISREKSADRARSTDSEKRIKVKSIIKKMKPTVDDQDLPKKDQELTPTNNFESPKSVQKIIENKKKKDVQKLKGEETTLSVDLTQSTPKSQGDSKTKKKLENNQRDSLVIDLNQKQTPTRIKEMTSPKDVSKVKETVGSIEENKVIKLNKSINIEEKKKMSQENQELDRKPVEKESTEQAIRPKSKERTSPLKIQRSKQQKSEDISS